MQKSRASAASQEHLMMVGSPSHQSVPSMNQVSNPQVMYKTIQSPQKGRFSISDKLYKLDDRRGTMDSCTLQSLRSGCDSRVNLSNASKSHIKVSSPGKTNHVLINALTNEAKKER